MKVSSSVFSASFFLAAALIVVCAKPFFAEDKASAIKFDTRISEMETLWIAGKTTDYYSEAEAIAEDLTVKPKDRDTSPAIFKLLSSLLSKEVVPNEIEATDLHVMWELVQKLLSDTTLSPEERATNARLISRYLGKIRKELIPNYKWKPVYANFSPTNGWGKPEAIKDPVRKAEYETAVHQNAENNRTNSRQDVLRSIDEQLSKKIINYLSETFTHEDITSLDFKECLKNARLTSREKEELLRKVSQKDCSVGDEKSATLALFEKQISQAEDLWKAGRTTDYYSQAQSIAHNIKANSKKENLNSAAFKVFDSVISKDPGLEHVSIEIVAPIEQLASYLLSDNRIPTKERRRNLKSLSRYLGNIRRQISSDSRKKQTSGNLLAAPGYGKPSAGRLKEVENRKRQAQLEELNWWVSKGIVNYMLLTFDAKDIGTSDFTGCINAAELTTREREELVEKISQKTKSGNQL